MPKENNTMISKDMIVLQKIPTIPLIVCKETTERELFGSTGKTTKISIDVKRRSPKQNKFLSPKEQEKYLILQRPESLDPKDSWKNLLFAYALSHGHFWLYQELKSLYRSLALPRGILDVHPLKDTLQARAASVAAAGVFNKEEIKGRVLEIPPMSPSAFVYLLYFKINPIPKAKAISTPPPPPLSPFKTPPTQSIIDLTEEKESDWDKNVTEGTWNSLGKEINSWNKISKGKEEEDPQKEYQDYIDDMTDAEIDNAFFDVDTKSLKRKHHDINNPAAVCAPTDKAYQKMLASAPPKSTFDMSRLSKKQKQRQSDEAASRFKAVKPVAPLKSAYFNYYQ